LEDRELGSKPNIVNPTRHSSLKGKEKDVTKKIIIMNIARSPKIQRHFEDRELNQARSKPNIVN